MAMNKSKQAKLAELIDLSNKLTQQLIAQSGPQMRTQPIPPIIKAEVQARIVKQEKDQFNHWFFFASLVMLFVKLTEITQIGWQGVFAPLLILGMIKIKSL